VEISNGPEPATFTTISLKFAIDNQQAKKNKPRKISQEKQTKSKQAALDVTSVCIVIHRMLCKHFGAAIQPVSICSVS
jgi:hypothetical protein